MFENNEDKDIKYTFIYFISFIHFILKNKLKILFINLGLLVLTLIYVFSLKNTYSTKISFISPTSDLVANYSDLSSSLSPQVSLVKGGGLSLTDPAQIYVEIIKSRNVREYVVDKLKLVSEFNHKNKEQTLLYLNKIVTTKINSGIININVETQNPELSYKISKEYISYLSEFLNKINVQQANETKSFIEKRLSETTDKITNVTDNLKKFQFNNNIIDIKSQSDAVLSIISELEKKILISESELKSITTIYKESSPKALSIKSQIDNLKLQLNKFQSKQINNSDSSLSSQSIYTISNNSPQYLSIIRDLKVLEEVFTLLVKQYEISKISSSKDRLVLKVIDKPYVPSQKSGPSRLLIAIMIMFIFSSMIFLYFLIKFNLLRIFNNDLSLIKKSFITMS